MSQSIALVAMGVFLGILLCVILGLLFKCDFFGKIFKKLEYAIMLISAILLVIGIVSDSLSEAKTISITYFNVFTSIIFSWLLTKWSAKKEYEEQEIELAKISYRHIQQTEASVITLTKEIREFLNPSEMKESDTVNADATEELRNVLSTLEHLKGSIGANKQDWLDKLPEGYARETAPDITSKILNSNLGRLTTSDEPNQELA